MEIRQTGHLSTLSDIDLFIALCSEQDDGAIYEEFVNRFSQELTDECKKYCKSRNLDSHVAVQIAHDTLEKARKYKSFRTDDVKLRNERKAVLVYLLRISNNLLNDHYWKDKKATAGFQVNRSYFDDLFETVHSAADPEQLARIKEAAISIIQSLSEKQRIVILKDLEYKRHQKYLPDDITAQLAEELGVKSASIRKIRERAIEKIKKKIHEINPKN